MGNPWRWKLADIILAGGIDTAVQINWNSVSGQNGNAADLVADDEGSAVATTASVVWASNGSWSSTGRGEENNGFPDGPDRTLLVGYLDTGNATTTTVTITNVPAALTSVGYDVVVYTLGGVSARGGSFRVLSAPGEPLSEYKLVSAPANPAAYVEDTGESHDESGTYMVFSGLSAATIIIEGTTTLNPLGGTPRAPINAVQLVQIGGEARPVVRPATANAAGFTVFVDDIGAAVVDPATVTTVLDGASVTATVSKNGSRTTIKYDLFADQDTFFESGSQHTLVVTLNDTQGNETVANQTLTIAPYATVPPDYVLAAPPTVPGLVVNKVFQTTAARTPGGSANNTPTAEMQLAGGMIDINSGSPLANIAENPGPINISGDSDGGLYWTANVNWEQLSGNITAAAPYPDNFNTVEPAGSGGLYSNEYPPGILLGDDPNNFVLETVGYVMLERGLHRWGVNSDDGFKVTTAPGQPSVVGMTLGEFDGGRGAADTTFDFVVETHGYYPIRLLWWEGDSGANCEWFSVDIDTGEKYLIGDVANNPANAYAVFRTGQGRARVQSMNPANGYDGTETLPTIQAVLQDGRTTVVDGTVQLWVDGAQVTAQVQNGATTTVSWTPANPYPNGTAHTGALVWDESTTPVTTHSNYFTFAIAPFTPDTLPADSFWIEAEDFDYNRGQTVAAASTMPYPGGAYQGLIAVTNVDYMDNETSFPFDDAGTSYRGSTRDDPATMIRSTLAPVNGAEQYATSRPGGFTTTSNYKIGWVGGDNWWNYTRTIPAGVYRAFSAQSQGSATDIVRSTLYRVTAGVGQPNDQQVLQTLGVFRSIGSPGWSQNILCPLRTADAANAPAAAFKLPGGAVTLRWQGLGGDHDWMVLVPSPDVPASLVSATPADGSTDQPADVQVAIRLEDFGTVVDQSSIVLTFDGVDVTASAVINKAGDITSIDYDPGTLAGGSHSYTITFADDADPPKLNTTTASFTVASSGQPTIDSIVINGDGSITVTWSGSAVLEAAPAVTGPWAEVAGATSPYTLQPTESMLFGRLRQ